MKHFFAFIFDPDLLMGLSGTAMTIVFPMLEGLTDIFKLLGSIGGLILVYLSIRHKILEIKKIKDGRTSKHSKH